MRGKPMLCKTGSARVRKAFYMPSLVAMQCNPALVALGKNVKVIVCTVMRKLVHTIVGVLKSACPFD